MSDKSYALETLNKTTIIILSHYSDQDVSRILYYYGDVNVDILVADSSVVPFPDYKRYKNIRYFHYANFSFHEKMADIFNHVNTPYVILCGDDDFIVPSGIISCTEFLESHPDYAAVQGHYVNFTAERSRIIKSPLYYGVAGLDIKSINTAERVELSMHPYMHWFYSVHRTENLKFFFQEIHFKISNHALCEIALTLISAINGNLTILPVFYCARDSYKSINRYVSPSVLDTKTNPELREEYNIFLSLVIDHYWQKAGSSQTDGRRCVEQAIEGYIQNSIAKKSKNIRPISVIRNKINIYLKRFSPNFLLQYYQGWRLHRLIGNNRGYPFFDLKAKKEWEIIKSVIIKHSRHSEKSQS